MTGMPLTDSATVPVTLTYGTRLGDFVGAQHAATLERRGRAWADCAAHYEALFTGQPTAVQVNEVRAEFPDVQYEDVFADALSMHILKNPRGYDVCAMDNLFGDILSDEASQLTGSLGMLPSASLGADRNQHGHRRGLYEPIHGAAHDITGKGIANPLAMILSVALMLRWSFGLHAEADRIEAAVNKVLVDGLRCGDIKSEGTTVLGTKDMGDAVVARL